MVALSFSRYMLGVFLNPTRVVALGLQNHYRNSFRMALSSSFASRSATSPAPRAQKPTVIVIAGPTAVGKSALALELCRSLDKPGEVVSADSVQVYRHLNIGSNKASDEERAAVKHHLIDVIEPNERYTAGRFVREADAAIADMLERHASEQQILPSSGQNAGGEEIGVPAAVCIPWWRGARRCTSNGSSMARRTPHRRAQRRPPRSPRWFVRSRPRGIGAEGSSCWRTSGCLDLPPMERRCATVPSLPAPRS